MTLNDPSPMDNKHQTAVELPDSSSIDLPPPYSSHDIQNASSASELAASQPSVRSELDASGSTIPGDNKQPISSQAYPPSEVSHTRVCPSSKVLGSSVVHSRLTKTTCTSSTIAHSSVSDSVVDGSTIKHSNLSKAQIGTGAEVLHSRVTLSNVDEGSRVNQSRVEECVVEGGAVIEYCTLKGCVVEGGTYRQMRIEGQRCVGGNLLGKVGRLGE